MSIFAVTVVALGINLLAVNEKPNDAMKAVMNGNTAANASARAAAKAKDYPALVKEAGNYRANLGYIDAYFTHKKLDAAATIAKGGMKAAMDSKRRPQRRTRPASIKPLPPSPAPAEPATSSSVSSCLIRSRDQASVVGSHWSRRLATISVGGRRLESRPGDRRRRNARPSR